MGVKERREREKQEIRALILDTARDMFINEGFEQVSMRKLAKKIEYSATAIYLHFKDKETLFYELCQSDFQVLMQSFAEYRVVVDPIERLKKMASAYVSFATQHPNQYRLLFMTPLGDKAKNDLALRDDCHIDEDAYNVLKATIAEAIATGRLRDGLKDSDLIAQIFFASLHGVVSVNIAKGKHQHIDWRPVTEQSDLLVDLTLRGAML